MANSIFSDLNFKPLLDVRGDLSTVTEIDAIKQSITQILHTRPGDRVMRPTFGSDLSTVLFDLMDEFFEDKIRDIVTNAINNWEPRVTILDVSTVINPDTHSGVITLYIDLSGLSSGLGAVSMDIPVSLPS